MSDELGPFIKLCSITPKQAARVSEMINLKFPTIEMAIDPDREKYGSFPTTPSSKRQVWVAFCIPREGISVPDFMGEFCKTLNQEPTIAVQKERK
jgi:hypothetical protein